MSELSEVFGFQQEDGQEPDFDAIFGGGEPTEAPPIPIEEPKTTDIPAAEIPAAEIPAADVPTAEPHPEESAAASAKETARPEAPKTTHKAKSKTKEPEAEPDLFSAFNNQADTPEPPVQSTEAVPVGAGQVSLFDKAPIFSYGSAKEPMINGLIECDTPHIIKGRIVKVKDTEREELFSSFGEHTGAEVRETVSNKMIFNVLTPQGFRSLT